MGKYGILEWFQGYSNPELQDHHVQNGYHFSSFFNGADADVVNNSPGVFLQGGKVSISSKMMQHHTNFQDELSDYADQKLPSQAKMGSPIGGNGQVVEKKIIEEYDSDDLIRRLRQLQKQSWNNDVMVPVEETENAARREKFDEFVMTFKDMKM